MEEKKSKKPIIIGIAVTLLVTLTLLGVTYAYYRTRIIGNQNDTSISVTSKTLEIVYADDNAVIAPTEKISPGYSTSKQFTVQNTGDEDVTYSVIVDNVETTFIRMQDWEYSLKKGSTEVASGKMNSDETQIIIGSITTKTKTTDSYTLTITYIDSVDDQSDDMGATLSLRVNIKEEASAWEIAEEGTLLYALKNNNEVVEPLTAPGKTVSGRIYTEGEFGTEKTSGTLTTEKQNSIITYGTGYEFDKDSGMYYLTGVQSGTYSEIYSKLVNVYLYSCTFNYNIVGSSQLSVYTSNGSANVCKVSSATADNYTYSSKNRTTTTITEAVLASTEDDYGDSYYFRGSVENNYVNFAGMCWRIVRVQGDGTIKIILQDKDNECDSENYNYANSTINTEGNVSYLGPNQAGYPEDLIYEDSTLKLALDSWLYGGEHMEWYVDSSYNVVDEWISFEKTIDDSYLAETDWCSELIYSRTAYYNSNGAEVDDISLAENSEDQYTTYVRLNSLKTVAPTLKCHNDATKIKSKVGALTADEVVFAGESLEYNFEPTYYLDNGREFWTMSPAYTYYSSEGTIESYNVYYVGSNGNMGGGFIEFDGSVRPVVVLRSDVTISDGGLGTLDKPYVIS